ncbi:MAG: hypothetical protein ACTHMA_07020 [Thermomicrobiales bacterium]|nr:hypothetical protein [Thermomicrobiales bacterium]
MFARIARRRMRILVLALTAALAIALVGAGLASANTKKLKFDMVRSPGIVTAGCLPNATGTVTIRSLGPVESLTLEVNGLAPNAEYDFFVIQVPNAPFGVSWYQGDIETDAHGHGYQRYIGRFNIETFAVAPNTAPAPVVHPDAPFPDASSNPPFAPVHMFHLGLWFNSPQTATSVGCPGATTPFNGDHTAGVQVLNTSNFANDQGPLRQIVP